jgi:hypothetical protein
MSLQSLKSALSTAEFAPHTLTLGSELGFGALSPRARAFFITAFPAEIAKGELRLLSAEPWSADTLIRYRSLEPDERMEALAFTGFHNHELVHRIDFLTTPFGASFHGKACLESIGLLLEAAELIGTLENDEPERPLRDIPPLADGIMVSSGIETLNARIRWFDSLRGASPKHLEPGWMAAPASINLAYQKLELTMVHELLPTLAIPGVPGAYLRPLTILESRAVALTALLLLNRLGGDLAAANEVVLFLETFYTPRKAFPDYRFLLDLFVGLWGAGDFLSLVEEHGVDGLNAVLKGIAVLGWYALHASPEANPDAPANSSPMLRLMVALQDLHARLRDGNKRIEAVEFLESIDTGDYADQFGFAGSRETLAYSVLYVRKVRQHNYFTNPHAGLKAHFETVLSIQQQQLERRHEHGYDFPAGMPENGSAIAGLGTEEYDGRLLFGREEPSAEVHDWFRLREMLLFRHARPPGFWEELWNAIGTHPGIETPGADKARQWALERARFVAGGVWPVEGGIKPIEDGERDLVFLPVRASLLPLTYRAAEADEAVTVETAWQVLQESGEPIVALRVSFPDAEEEVRLLFSPSLHRPTLKALRDSKLLAFLSDDAYLAFGQDKPHPATIEFPVVARSEVIANVVEEAPAFDLTQNENGWLATFSRNDGESTTVSIEAYAWPTSDHLEQISAAIKRADLGPVLITLSGLLHHDDAELRVLAVTGANDSPQKLRKAVIEGSEETAYPLSREDAEKLLSEFQHRVLEMYIESGEAPYSLAEQDPLPVRLE